MLCVICSTEFTNRKFTNRLICEECCNIAKLALTTGAVNNSTTEGVTVNILSASLKARKQEIENAMQREREMKEKLNYLSSFVAAFRDQIHTDIRIKPGTNGPSIPTHRALLASRSVIFKNMLDSDGCKAPSDHTVVPLPELSYEELDSLLEFLYTGELPKEKLDKHVYSLSVAADKYEISFLQTYCEREMLRSLNTSNALDVLEISETYPNPHIKLKEVAMSFIVEHIEDIVFTARFDAFAAKNPHLALQITRDSVAATKKRKIGV